MHEPKELLSHFLTLKNDGTPDPEIYDLIRIVTGLKDDVHVESLKGGITNQLFLARQNGLKLLVRAYGKGTSAFINRDREFAVHMQLTKLALAPRLFARFGNGLIYAYIPGRATDYHELRNPSIISDVARRLAQWHVSLRRTDVAKIMGQDPGDLWDLLTEWVEMCPSDVLSISKEDLRDEFQWVKKNLKQRGGPEVMGHCDLLSGNILVRECPEAEIVSENDAESCNFSPSPVPMGYKPGKNTELAISNACFIDYEYAIPCPRAFDIANHFQEWQGFSCDKELVPVPSSSDELLTSWVSEYLNACAALRHEEKPEPAHKLISELAFWWGMPGFYWGIWSAIQSKASEIDFDYAGYAVERFSEYINWKKTIWCRLE